MQKFLIFVLQLYLAVILTLYATDQILAYQRLAQFKKMEDCCVSAADQYASFSAVYKTASTLDALAQLDDLSRLDRYKAISSWEQALMSPAKDDIAGDWDLPGAEATDRLEGFLARRKVTPTAVASLAQRFRDAGPDIDPELTEDEEKAAHYLAGNLTYLSAVTGVARTELRDILAKQAGGQRELEDFVASRAANKKVSGYRVACASFRGVEQASSLGKVEKAPDDDVGFLDCIREALKPESD